MAESLSPSPGAASFWDQRYRDGTDAWELGQPAPPLAAFLQGHSCAPQPPGRVLVPGCGRGHEAALLADLGFSVVGLDFSREAIREARQLHGSRGGRLHWLQADLFDAQALEAAGLAPASLHGVLEHTCFCAIEPIQRTAYRTTVLRLLKPGGWLLGLFFCHGRPDGPPYGSDPDGLLQEWLAAGCTAEIWEPAQGSVAQRSDEWLGLFRTPTASHRSAE
ncbi:TPMT family class I SAM-dependent methyltransferase [Synechococcus sp. FGCU-3]|nr:TPMT family class I SAM-dependent methyltransferase [Synechococcus sp. FGCU3]